jgi:ABC-type branched-subunit amino acid transport system permease subunit
LEQRAVPVLWAAGIAKAFPFVIKQELYILHVAIVVFFNICLATSMWLIWSLGFVSFAHAGFMGIGAYTSRCSSPAWGCPCGSELLPALWWARSSPWWSACR